MSEKNYHLGLVSVSFRSETPEKIIEATVKSGLGAIEWGSDIHAPFDDEKKLKKIAKLQKEYGIICSSYGTYFRLGKTPLHELERYIAAAKVMGTDILRLWCYDKCRADMTEKEVDELLEESFLAAEIAKNHDVTLCMECHKKTFTENPDDAVFLMNEVNSENFRMYWQPFQWQCAEENIINARKIAPYTKNIHVFNWRAAEKLPLSDATEDWKKYLKEFSHPCNLLLEFMPNGTIDELSTEAESLRKIVGDRL